MSEPKEAQSWIVYCDVCEREFPMQLTRLARFPDIAEDFPVCLDCLSNTPAEYNVTVRE